MRGIPIYVRQTSGGTHPQTIATLPDAAFLKISERRKWGIKKARNWRITHPRQIPALLWADQWAPPWPVPFSVSCSNKLADRDSEAVRVSRKCRCQPPCLGPGVGITTGGFSFSLEWGVGIERSGTPSDGNATQLDPGLVGLFALRSGGGGEKKQDSSVSA